jgi:hypothetical protein
LFIFTIEVWIPASAGMTEIFDSTHKNIKLKELYLVHCLASALVYRW